MNRSVQAEFKIQFGPRFLDQRGIEPPTFSLQMRRSTTELLALARDKEDASILFSRATGQYEERLLAHAVNDDTIIPRFILRATDMIYHISRISQTFFGHGKSRKWIGYFFFRR